MRNDMLSDVCTYFFFFQAEDGIRDDLVTGVQTCALPISGFLQMKPVSSGYIVRIPPGWRACGWLAMPRRVRSSELQLHSPGVFTAGKKKRTEERRVGEEGRSRWSPYH